MKTTSETVLELEPPYATRDAMRTPARTSIPSERRTPAKASGADLMPPVIIGTLVGFSQSRAPLVDFPGNESGIALPARTMIALNEHDAGCEIALVFENGDAAKPVILGRLQSQNAGTNEGTVNVSLDGEQVALSAKNEIVLRCGKASITLTRAGKIIIRGAYLLSRSSGVNRIKGGSVQIN
jgi:hypothetical protein